MSDSKKHEEGNNEVQKEENLTQKERDRRRLLKSAVLGAGVATTPVWIRPVVNTVVLPAHAQSSIISTSTFPVTSTFLATTSLLVTTTPAPAPTTTAPPLTSTTGV